MYDLDLHLHIWMYIINIMFSKKSVASMQNVEHLGICAQRTV